MRSLAQRLVLNQEEVLRLRAEVSRLRSAAARVLSAARGTHVVAGRCGEEFRDAVVALERLLDPLRVEEAEGCRCDYVHGDGRPDGYRGGVMRNVTCPIHGDPMAGKPLRVEDLLDGLPCALTGQDCVDRRHVHLTNAPRLSTEDEALRLMGDGQPLVKMREIGGGK